MSTGTTNGSWHVAQTSTAATSASGTGLWRRSGIRTYGAGCPFAGPANAPVSMVRAMLRTVQATRYVAPLREGGSLPGLVEADDDGLYVLKFRGAGQGPWALVAEVVGGELARAAGLPVPEIVLVEVDARLGHAEPDPEIQDLIAASPGTNAGVDFLPGALGFTPAPGAMDPGQAAEVV